MCAWMVMLTAARVPSKMSATWLHASSNLPDTRIDTLSDRIDMKRYASVQIPIVRGSSLQINARDTHFSLGCVQVKRHECCHLASFAIATQWCT